MGSTQELMHLPMQTTAQALRPLRIIAVIEGATLLALLGIAVPLKHLAGYPHAVTVIGPIHGAAFLLYFWTLFNVASSDGWSRREIAHLAVTALVPFGVLLGTGLLSRKAATADDRSRLPCGEHGA